MTRRLALAAALIAACTWLALRPQAAARPNVVLICVDGCRADHLSGWGYRRPTSPFIDQKAREGAAFMRNYAQANESLFSHASLFSSRYASEIGPLDYMRFRIPPTLPTLQKILAANGYHTGAFTGGGHIQHEFGFAQGFEIYTDYFSFDGFAVSEPKATSWMRAHRDAPMFVFLHGYDCHRPYHGPAILRHLYGAGYEGVAERALHDLDRIYDSTYYPDYDIYSTWTLAGQLPVDPRNYLTIADEARSGGRRGIPLSPRDVEHLVSHYDSAISYADAWLSVFFADMADMGLDRSNTIVVIVADHGEDLMEHGYFNHRVGLQTSNLHVPLIVWGAGISAGKRFDFPTANVDVAPTLLAMLGISPPSGMRGQDLSIALNGGEVPPAWQERAIFSQGMLGMSSLVTREHQLICSGAQSGTPDMQRLLQTLDPGHLELYDLAKDPRETVNLVGAQPQAAGRLRDMLLAMERDVPVPSTAAAKPIDPALDQTLRAHGYK